MDPLLWMGLGAVLTLLSSYLYAVVVTQAERRANRRRRAIRRQRESAEVKMQVIVQDTIQRLFESARGYQR